MAHKAEYIYYLARYRKSLLGSLLEDPCLLVHHRVQEPNWMGKECVLDPCRE